MPLPDDIRAPRPVLTPVFEATPGPWRTEHPRNDHQLIFPLAGDRLLLVWARYYADRPSQVARRRPEDRAVDSHDEMPCRLVGRISTDRARTWGPVFTLQENRWRCNVKHPNLLRLNSGELLFTFTGWDHFNDKRELYAKRSADEGEHWSEPAQISVTGWHCQNNDHILRLRSGRIVLPAHGGGGCHFSYDKADYDGLRSYMLLSDDDGRTWRPGRGQLGLPDSCVHEPGVVELRDGRLLAMVRTNKGRLHQAHSADGGETWTTPAPVPQGLPTPQSPPLLKRIPATGDLLLIWNAASSSGNHPRMPLTAAISRDDGATWGCFADLDRQPGADSAYAAVTFVGDEVVVTWYCRRARWRTDSEVMLRIFKLRQFYE